MGNPVCGVACVLPLHLRLYESNIRNTANNPLYRRGSKKGPQINLKTTRPIHGIVVCRFFLSFVCSFFVLFVRFHNRSFYVRLKYICYAAIYGFRFFFLFFSAVLYTKIITM